MLNQFIEYIKTAKFIYLDELASQFKLRTQVRYAVIIIVKTENVELVFLLKKNHLLNKTSLLPPISAEPIPETQL